MHVAIIMDGNGRWATQRGLPRTAGHVEGAKAVRTVVEAAARAGVDTVTSDSAGNATFNVWPRLREAPPAGASIITKGTQGMFRLAKNEASWNESYLTTYGVTFTVREAI